MPNNDASSRSKYTLAVKFKSIVFGISFSGVCFNVTTNVPKLFNENALFFGLMYLGIPTIYLDDSPCGVTTISLIGGILSMPVRGSIVGVSEANICAMLPKVVPFRYINTGTFWFSSADCGIGFGS